MKHIVAAAFVAFGVLPVSARSFPPETRSFVYLHDNKPGGSETFTRSADAIRGDIVLGKSRVHYEGRIAADGTIPRLDIRTSRSDDGADAPRLISMIAGHDNVQVVERIGRKADTVRVTSQPGTIPIFDPSIGLYEVVVARARSQR